MGVLNFAFFCGVFACFSGVFAAKYSIPSYITKCKRKDPNLEKCLLTAIKTIQPYLKNGVPELGLPSLNPLTIPYAGLENGPSFNASFSNLEIYDADKFEITEMKIDLEKVHLDLQVKFPRVRIRSTYNIDGKILFINLKGSGPADGNFTDIVANVKGDGNFKTKNGKQHLSIDKIDLKASYGKPVLIFENLFENQPEVTEQTNRVINNSIEDIIKELEPVINEVVVEIVKAFISRVFDKFSFDELFPL